MTEINDMPDAELVRCVAVEVMPERWTDAYPTWFPLTDWNDAMMIVDAMRAKDWHPAWAGLSGVFGFMRPYDDGGTLGTQFFSSYAHSGNVRRALLESALAVVRKGGE